MEIPADAEAALAASSRDREPAIAWLFVGARATVATCMILFAIGAAFRFLALKNGFVNDHFVYISGGRQMLLGEWPTRDWIDPGLPFMFAASALAQAIFGQTLFAEGMLVSIAFGLAAAFTAATVRRLTGSLALAIAAAVLEIAVFPRTYSYPKIAAYALEFWLYGRYVSRPTTPRLFAMAAGVAMAFMFRHDHGLFLWVGGLFTTLLARESNRWGEALKDAVLFTACLVALLLPYLIYVHMYGDLWVYFRTGIEFSRREAARQWHVWPRVFGDTRPLESAMVYELHVLPLIASIVLFMNRKRDDARALAARVLPVAVVGVLVNVSFIRDPLNTRLADAIVPAVTLGAWLLSYAWSRSRLRALTIPVSLAFTLLLGASVLAVGSTYDEIDRAGLLGRRQEIPHRFVERTSDLQARFTDYQLPTPAARRLVPFFQYLDRCTSRQDRLLIGGFMVEVPFYAQRLFAGGQEYFGAYFESNANQRFAFDRLRRQSVPFVILPTDYEDEFYNRFPAVAAYVRARYSPLTEVSVSDELTIHILVNRDMPVVSRDRETGWPCSR
jgi:hypothetical protein